VIARDVCCALSILFVGCTTCREESEPQDGELEDGERALTEKVIHAPAKGQREEIDYGPRVDPPPRSKRTPTTPDPENGEFTVEEALVEMPGEGPVQAVIHTDLGRVTCKLYTDKAPRSAANFIGLARGSRSFWDARAGVWAKRPFYRGSAFHRVIPEFMIQGGCPYGDGSGDPGYTVPDERWEGQTHNRVGLLCMANRGPGTNGSQFFITDGTGGSTANLDRLESAYSIFGECTPHEVVHRIARVAQRGAPTNRPLTPMRINAVAIERQNGSDRPEPEERVGPTKNPADFRPGPNDYTPPGQFLPPRDIPPVEKRLPGGGR